jgi:hypothetical protein
VATRWPKSTALQGSQETCHVSVALQIQGDREQAEVVSKSRWISPGGMSDKAPKVCEQERRQVLERTAAVIVPPPTLKSRSDQRRLEYTRANWAC